MLELMIALVVMVLIVQSLTQGYCLLVMRNQENEKYMKALSRAADFFELGQAQGKDDEIITMHPYPCPHFEQGGSLVAPDFPIFYKQVQVRWSGNSEQTRAVTLVGCALPG